MRKPTFIISFFFIASLFFQGRAAAWKIPSLQTPPVPFRRSSKTPSPTSTIPQFIRDIDHPWLATHADKLSKLDDPKSVLCTPLEEVTAQYDQPPSFNQYWQLNRLDVPDDLFRRLGFDGDGCGSGWSGARQRLLEIKACPRALVEVRDLKVDVSAYQGESVLPPEDLPGLLAEVMESMTGLKKLDLRIGGLDENKIFETAFAERGTELASVKELKVNTYASWLIGSTPSVEILEPRRDVRRLASHLYKDWFKNLGGLKQLKSLHLHDLRWDAEMTELVSEALPEIEELWVGSFNHGYRAPEGEALHNLTRNLATLPKLKRLRLPWSASLNLGFDGGPICGNFFDGEEGAKYRRQVQLEHLESTERAGDIVHKDIPRLKDLYVGDFYGNFTVDNDGNDVTIWPWTERLEDWLEGYL